MTDFGTTSTANDISESINGSMMGDEFRTRSMIDVHLRFQSDAIVLPFNPGMIKIWVQNIHDGGDGDFEGSEGAIFSLYWNDYTFEYKSDLILGDSHIWSGAGVINKINVYFDLIAMTYLVVNGMLDNQSGYIGISYILNYVEWT